MGYTKDAVKGVMWLSGFRMATRAFSLIKTFIIARILTPAQFGVFGIATISLSLLEVLTETGINILLTQQKKDVDSFIDTAWIVSIIRGCIIGAIIWLSSPLIATFFNSAEASRLLPLISLVAVIRGFINPSVAKFVKDLNFAKEFYYRTSIFLVETILSLVLTLLMRSPIALVLGLVGGAIFEMILSFVIILPRPHFKFNFAIFTQVLHQGKWITLSGIFSYLYMNIDNIVVGKVLGTSILGVYDMAYKVSMLPISEITDVVGKATFPVYVKIDNDTKRLKKAFLKTASLMLMLTIPVGLVLYFFPEFVISILLGDQWLSAAPVLKILAIYTIIRSILTAPAALFYGLGKQTIVTHINFISFIGLALTIYPFTQRWGMIGATGAVLFGTLLSLPVVAYYLRSTLSKR